MWRYLGCAVAYWAVSGAAQAQSPPSIDWSGFHVSGLVGGTRSDSDTRTTARRDGSTYFTGNDFNDIAREGRGHVAEWAWSGSLKGGYSRQFGNVLVGLEASADTLFLDEARFGSKAFLDQQGSRFTIRQKVKADWMGTLRPRLGWAQDGWLAYITAGPAVTRVTVETTYSDNFPFGGQIGALGHSSSTKTKYGAALGLGGEYALGQNWSLAAQYLYTDFGRVEASTQVAHINPAAGRSTLDTTADLRSHAAMIGVTYRFKGF